MYLLTFFFPVTPGHIEAVRLLLSKGVPVDPLNSRGTPLHLAAAMDHDQVVKILLQHGADVSHNYHYYSVELHMAHINYNGTF